MCLQSVTTPAMSARVPAAQQTSLTSPSQTRMPSLRSAMSVETSTRKGALFTSTLGKTAVKRHTTLALSSTPARPAAVQWTALEGFKAVKIVAPSSSHSGRLSSWRNVATQIGTMCLGNVKPLWWTRPPLSATSAPLTITAPVYVCSTAARMLRGNPTTLR